MISAIAYASAVAATSPMARFDDAARYDLEGRPQLAFAAYLDAAEAGLPEAEFNVAVMLDSGRGVRSDLSKAAVWYARAAAHGVSRAAYNLGQLYESGQGVPKNEELARAWFEASRLPASRDHLTGKRREIMRSASISAAPELLAPLTGSEVSNKNHDIELVWTSQDIGSPVRYNVEIYLIGKSEKKQVFSSITRLSSIVARIDETGNESYAWRVTSIATRSGQYFISKWNYVTIK